MRCAPGAATLDGRALWTADTLRSPEWAYLSDAVARARAGAGGLDVAAVEDAATWTIRDAALSLGVSEQAVGAAIASGDLPAVKVRGVFKLDPRVVRAHVPKRAAGRTSRVPALYAHVGDHAGAELRVVVRAQGGGLHAGELLSSIDGVDTLLWTDWSEAAVLWGRSGVLRAARLRPAHGVQTVTTSIGELGLRGRWTFLEREDATDAAVALFRRAQKEWAAAPIERRADPHG